MPRGAAGVGRGEGPEPVQLAHEIARKNRGAPGSPRGVWTIVGLLPAVVMAAVDARRRSVAASLAWAVALFAFSAAGLARSPAFRVMVPGPVETGVALDGHGGSRRAERADGPPGLRPPQRWRAVKTA